MERQALPLIPVPFRLVVRQVRTEEGYVTDPVATRQLEVLRGLLENADGLVIATDAGRGGELVSRDLLDYLGYRKPALRLWISSLTEKAILDGFKNLREDSDFDNLAQAARARREADWILGVNAGRKFFSHVLSGMKGKRMRKKPGSDWRAKAVVRSLPWKRKRSWRSHLCHMT